MSDEQDNKPQETPKDIKPQELPKDNKSQETPKESKIIELNESFAGKSQPGGQGISLKPVGGHNTNPFTSQDTNQPQTIMPSQPVNPPSAPAPAQTDTTSDSNE